MKIKESVRQMLGSHRGHAIVMYALNCSFSSVRVYIKENRLELTTAAVLDAIRKEYGLQDADILEVEETIRG